MLRAERAAIADGITGTPVFLAGRTGQPLQPLEVSALDASALQLTLDQLLGA